MTAKKTCTALLGAPEGIEDKVVPQSSGFSVFQCSQMRSTADDDLQNSTQQQNSVRCEVGTAQALNAGDWQNRNHVIKSGPHPGDSMTGDIPVSSCLHF